MDQFLLGKVSLVTGASRGIGAEIAVNLAELGSDVVLNYRSKSARAEEVAERITMIGRTVLLSKADITVRAELAAMLLDVETTFGRIDLLILNASGGLERGKAEDYAMSLNRDAQLRTAELAMSLMPPGARIVFVTSHWAHFHGTKPVIPEYEAVAKSKRAGEDALRDCMAKFGEKGISLIVVSGDVIEGTITPKLLARKSPRLAEQRATGGAMPTVEEFAAAIVSAAIDVSLPSGHTIFVGSV